MQPTAHFHFVFALIKKQRGKAEKMMECSINVFVRVTVYMYMLWAHKSVYTMAVCGPIFPLWKRNESV